IDAAITALAAVPFVTGNADERPIFRAAEVIGRAAPLGAAAESGSDRVAFAAAAKGRVTLTARRRTVRAKTIMCWATESAAFLLAALPVRAAVEMLVAEVGAVGSSAVRFGVSP